MDGLNERDKRWCGFSVAAENEPIHTRCAIASISFDAFATIGTYLDATSLSRLLCTGSPFVTTAVARLEDVRWSMDSHRSWGAAHDEPSLLMRRCAPGAVPLHSRLRHLLVSQPQYTYNCRACGRGCMHPTRFPIVEPFVALRTLVIDDRLLLDHIVFAGNYALDETRGGTSLAQTFPVLESLRIRAHPKYRYGTREPALSESWRHFLTHSAFPPSLLVFEIVQVDVPQKGDASDLLPLYLQFAPRSCRALLSKLPFSLEVLRLPVLALDVPTLRNLPTSLRVLGVSHIAGAWADPIHDAVTLPPSLQSLHIANPSYMTRRARCDMVGVVRTQCPLIDAVTMHAMFESEQAE